MISCIVDLINYTHDRVDKRFHEAKQNLKNQLGIIHIYK